MNAEITEVVHELNNVITAILVGSGLLEQRLEPGSPLLRYAAGIRESGENGVRLIRELQAQTTPRKPGAWKTIGEPRRSRREPEGAGANHRRE
jgi:hypothetical protein